MTDIRVLPAYFQQKEEAIAEIMNDGYWPISWVDKPGCSYAPHRHRDRETLYRTLVAFDDHILPIE